MGRKLILGGTKLTDTKAPKLARIDSIEAAGSLILLDPVHPYISWDSGVPANSAMVPNVFGENLAALGGLGETRPTVISGAGINDGVKGRIERTPKGALHGVVSQSVDLVSGDGFAFKMPPALIAYLNANKTHAYYMSIWDTLTRPQAGSVQNYVVSYNTGTSNFNTGLMSASTQGWYDGESTIVALTNFINPVNAAGNRRYDAAVSSTNTAFSNSNHIGPSFGAPTGHASAAVLSTRNRLWPSFAFYRQYVEDLTVSGRTYAEVAAIDNELYTREVLTPGGRYYGDTVPTSPATLP